MAHYMSSGTLQRLMGNKLLQIRLREIYFTERYIEGSGCFLTLTKNLKNKKYFHKVYILTIVRIIHMDNFNLDADYLYCHAHGTIVESEGDHMKQLLSGQILQPELPCMITGEYYNIKKTTKKRVEQLPRNVVDTMGMKIYHPVLDKKVQYVQDQIPDGSVIINEL
jgi:hypothetical protein